MYNSPKRHRRGGSSSNPQHSTSSFHHPQNNDTADHAECISFQPTSSHVTFSPSRRGTRHNRVENHNQSIPVTNDHDEKKVHNDHIQGPASAVKPNKKKVHESSNTGRIKKIHKMSKRLFTRKMHRMKKVAKWTATALLILSVSYNIILSFSPGSSTFDYESINLPDYQGTPQKQPQSSQRMFVLSSDLMSHQAGDYFQAKHGRQIELYPTEYSDITQTFPDADSSDPDVKDKMKFHPFPNHATDKNCVPTAEWQTTFHPSCNKFHEIALPELLHYEKASVLSESGSWRIVWNLNGDGRSSTGQIMDDGAVNYEEAGLKWREKNIVLKTLHYHYDIHDEYFEFQRVDAVAMDMLTSSKHVLDIYGFCGLSALNQFAGKYDGRSLTQLADHRRKYLDKLRLAKEIAQGLADIHSIDGVSSGGATLIHNDINTENILLSEEGVPLFNDFNIADFPMRNKITNEPCSPYTEFPSPQWKSPEEIRSYDGLEHKPLTEKVDIYALGNILFRFLTRQRAWRTGQGWTTTENLDILKQLKYNGTMPPVPEVITNSTDLATKALLAATLECYQFDPEKRPSAHNLVYFFDRAIKGIEQVQEEERLKARAKRKREKKMAREKAEKEEREAKRRQRKENGT